MEIRVFCSLSVVYTAASVNLGLGEEVKNIGRRPEIMADAAYAILTKASRSRTGQFLIDDDVLSDEGVTNFDVYNFVESKSF